LSKNPLDMVKEGKFGRDELQEALRLAIIAELDAINLYRQLARRIDDERFRKVFEDIAKEEKTHVGEFLALLKAIDEEQVKELEAGVKEVSELTGIKNIPKDPPSKNSLNSNVRPEIFSEEEWNYIVKTFNNTLNMSRKLRHYIPVYSAGRGVEGVIVESIEYAKGIQSTGLKLIPLHEISVEFRVKERVIDHMRRRGDPPSFPTMLYAASKLGYLEDETILNGADNAFKGLVNIDGALISELSNWEVPGNAVNDVASGVI